jgi:ferric-dicitrate binding protein FerR (iron transport regulator)
MNRLLAKYILEQATPAERHRVERWLAANPRHREELEKLRDRLELATRHYRHGAFNPRPALARVITPRPRALRHLPRAAAAILLLAACWYTLQPATGPLTITAPRGETRAILLPDGTRVTLEGPATITYPATFPRDKRETNITGTAYLEVTNNPRQPFTVHAPLVDILVLGTTFQVEGDNTRAAVLVREGHVRVTTAGTTNHQTLGAGTSVTYHAGEPRLTITPFDQNRLSWKTGEFQFRDTPLHEVITLLNRHFRVTIPLPDTTAAPRLTATFNQPTLHEALDIINQTLGLDITTE